MPHASSDFLDRLEVTVDWKMRSSGEFLSKRGELFASVDTPQTSQESGKVIACGPIRFTWRDKGLIAVLAGRVRDPEQDVQWRLTIGHQPSSEVPEGVLQTENRIGGLDGFISLLESTLDEHPKIADYRLQGVIQELAWRCKVLPRPAEGDAFGALENISPDAQLEQIGFRFPSGPNGLSELSIVYYHKPKIFGLNVLGRAAYHPSQESPFSAWIEDTLQLTQSRFFQSAETENALGV